MAHLHTRAPPIVHRDFKSGNLLVNAAWVPQVADFDLSKLLDGRTATSSLATTNPRWLAPEVLAGEPAGLEGDGEG
jgi:serine/threonine protein kinase